jgi:large conductance mechanosensitive channel
MIESSYRGVNMSENVETKVVEEETEKKEEAPKTKKQLRAEKRAAKRGAIARGEYKGIWSEFKAFISKGSVLNLAVGVVIGGAFGTIVTSVVNILLSICTYAVPGGLKGLITVLPAATDAQKGIEGIGQTFDAASMNEMADIYSSVFPKDANPLQGLKSLYTLHGSTYVYNQSAIIDWGSAINAVISFLIIALVLFAIVKITVALQKKKAELDAKLLEEHYKKYPEDRPAPVEEVVPEPTETELLVEIRDLLKKKSK